MSKTENSLSEDSIEFMTSRRAKKSYDVRMLEMQRSDDRTQFLRQVALHAPFYSQFPALLAQAATASAPMQLEHFPLTDRAVREAHRDALLLAAADHDPPVMVKATSGSTGTPFKVEMDGAMQFHLRDGVLGEVAAIDHSIVAKLTAGQLGVALVTNKHERFRSMVPILSLGGALFRRLIIGRSALEDELVLAELRANAPPVLHGTASYLRQLAVLDQSDNSALRIRPGIIVLSAENMYEDDRETLEQHFGCAVFNCYASSEGGLIARECREHSGLHVRSHRVTVEVISASGAVGDTGEGEIVITNWLNRRMPFIRYRTGDWGQLSSGPCRCGFIGSTITHLSGREARHFRSHGGKLVATSTLALFCLSLPVPEFQLSQARDNAIVLKYSGPSAAFTTDHQARVKHALTSALGPVVVRIEHVPRITQAGKKRLRFICEPMLSNQ